MTDETTQMTEVEKRILELRHEIEMHNYNYHVLDNPIISDAEFDALFRELRKLEEAHPEYISPESPTQRVGGSVMQTDFAKVRHPVPMLSLSNVLTEEELNAWDTRARKFLGGNLQFEYTVEPKIDGLAVALTYENGVLIRGATRGDGIIGEDITANLKTIKSIPLRLREIPGKPMPKLIEIRGEVYISIKAFEKLNQELGNKGEKLFANPRNGAAGSLRQKDPNITATRPLSIYVYTLGYIQEGPEIKTQWEALEYFQALGFRIAKDIKLCQSLKEVDSAVLSWLNGRDSLEFEIDGAVVKLNDFATQERLGYVGRDPRWATAYKFPAREGTTVLKDIILTVRRTGGINPKAVLEPVQIGGITVQNATLFNEDEIRRLGLKLGDWVVVKRAGDVIPNIVKVIEEKRTGQERDFAMPKFCPSCNAPTNRDPEFAIVYCTNSPYNCPDQIRDWITYFAAMMGIEGMGEKICHRFYNEGLIRDYADIYSLKKEQLTALERFGERLADKLLAQVQASKQRPLSTLLAAIGIRNVGVKAAETLARHFKRLDNLRNATLEEITEIKDMGEVAAKSIMTFFADPLNKAVIDKLVAAGINTEQQEDPDSGGAKPLAGQTFVITGTLLNFTRQAAEEMLKRKGATVGSSISKNTHYLVAGEKAGSKLTKAQELGIKIISEAELSALLSNA
jgi:DNA ligase (NAD+)